MVEVDRLQHLAAFPNAHATPIRDVPVPDGAFGVEAYAVRDAVTQVGPYPPVREAAVLRDVECREPVGVGLSEDQLRVVGRHGHTVGERNAIGHPPGRTVGGEQSDGPRCELAAREVEADVAYVGVAPTVH